MLDETLLLEIMTKQGWNFPLHYPLVLDSKGVKDWGEFQSYLKQIAILNQGGQCICGEDLGPDCELHHALVSRKDAMGLSFPELIHSPYNCLVLHHHCHENANRFDCATFLFEIFGYNNIYNWYCSMPFKSKFRNLPHAKTQHENKLLS